VRIRRTGLQIEAAREECCGVEMAVVAFASRGPEAQILVAPSARQPAVELVEEEARVRVVLEALAPAPGGVTFLAFSPLIENSLMWVFVTVSAVLSGPGAWRERAHDFFIAPLFRVTRNAAHTLVRAAERKGRVHPVVKASWDQPIASERCIRVAAATVVGRDGIIRSPGAGQRCRPVKRDTADLGLTRWRGSVPGMWIRVTLHTRPERDSLVVERRRLSIVRHDVVTPFADDLEVAATQGESGEVVLKCSAVELDERGVDAPVIGVTARTGVFERPVQGQVPLCAQPDLSMTGEAARILHLAARAVTAHARSDAREPRMRLRQRARPQQSPAGEIERCEQTGLRVIPVRARVCGRAPIQALKPAEQRQYRERGSGDENHQSQDSQPQGSASPSDNDRTQRA
jgi:hypothetical protein